MKHWRKYIVVYTFRDGTRKRVETFGENLRHVETYAMESVNGLHAQEIRVVREKASK